jgi:ribokinase
VAKPKIAVVGSYGVGMTMRLDHVPVGGETVSGGRYDAGPGGKGSNQAIGAARLGASVSLLTAVGNDALAADARALWEREGVDASHVVTGTAATMVGFILVESSGENRIVIAPGALDELSIDAVESFRDTMRAADVVVVSMEIPLDAVAAALRIAREVGTTVILNPAPASVLPEESWQHIDVVTPNQTEAPILLGLPADHGLSPRELVSALRARTEATIVLTLGSAGALVAEGETVVEVLPLAAPRVVDTTGAGDSFTAALAVAIAAQQPLREAARFAAAAGSFAVGVEGVIDALPFPDDIERVLAAG